MYTEFLQNVPLFAQLPKEDLTRLCAMVNEVSLPAGAELFAEGSSAESAYILFDGELEIIKHIDGYEVSIDLQDMPGTVIGEMALLEEGQRLATVRARRDSFLLMLDRRQVRDLLDSSPTATRVMLQTLARRSRALEVHVRHIEKMAQLGTLTAGMAHELNNPVAAVTRGAGQLQGLLETAGQAWGAMARLGLTAAQEARIAALDRQALAAVMNPPPADPLARSDRETEIEGWLEKHGVANPWEVAPVLADLDLGPANLDELARTFAPAQFPGLLRWLIANFTTRSLLHDIMQGAGRIANLVQSLKSYVFLDQAPVQNVDIHAGLDDTLMILQHKLTPQIQIRREYAPDLPQITAYGSELNQVWTNLLENAIDALPGRGEIIIRTRPEAGGVVVEIEDNGHGIQPAHLPKIFDPFFTTKAPGRGSGLGLSTSYFVVQQHQGQIEVASEPGRTVFSVFLPLHFEPE